MNAASAVRYSVAGVTAFVAALDGVAAMHPSGVAATATFAVQPKSPAKDRSKPKQTATASSKEADAGSLREWQSLDARRQKLHARLKDLQSEFTVSSRVRKLEIKKEFERLINEWKTDLAPKMVKLALAKLADDPDSELASRLAEDVADQRQVAAVTERLIKAGKDGGPVLRLAGLAHFHLNDFQRAAELLGKARDKNARLKDPGIIDVARDYEKSWQKELKLRKKESAATPETRLPQVRIETGKGNIIVELFENEAPNTVANFISLVESKFYDAQHFYNAQPLRAIEAGDPKTKPNYNKNLSYGFGGPGYTITTEATGDDARMHFRGSLSMVNYGKDTEGSLFAILRSPRLELNPSAGGLGGQTVFGRVVKGMDVVDKLDNGDKIVKMSVVRKRPHPYKPKTSVDKDEPEKKDATKKGEPAKSKSGAKSKAPAFPKSESKPKGEKPTKAGKSKE